VGILDSIIMAVTLRAAKKEAGKDPEFKKYMAKSKGKIKQLSQELEQNIRDLERLNKKENQERSLIKSRRPTRVGSIILKESEIKRHLVSMSLAQHRLDKMPADCQNIINKGESNGGLQIGYHSQLGWFIWDYEVIWTETGIDVKLDETVEMDEWTGCLNQEDVGKYIVDKFLLDLNIQGYTVVIKVPNDLHTKIRRNAKRFEYKCDIEIDRVSHEVKGIFDFRIIDKRTKEEIVIDVTGHSIN